MYRINLAFSFLGFSVLIVLHLKHTYIFSWFIEVIQVSALDFFPFSKKKILSKRTEPTQKLKLYLMKNLKSSLRIIYRGTCIRFECETSKNDSEIDIERRPLLPILLNRNPLDFWPGFTETTNRAHSPSASELFPESENPHFPGKRCR